VVFTAIDFLAVLFFFSIWNVLRGRKMRLHPSPTARRIVTAVSVFMSILIIISSKKKFAATCG
jgi:hypothetical protein